MGWLITAILHYSGLWLSVNKELNDLIIDVGMAAHLSEKSSDLLG